MRASVRLYGVSALDPITFPDIPLLPVGVTRAACRRVSAPEVCRRHCGPELAMPLPVPPLVPLLGKYP